MSRRARERQEASDAKHYPERWQDERDVRYRMYREVWDDYDRCHYRDVQGEWMPTKKEAKASYKIALAAHRNKMKELANA